MTTKINLVWFLVRRSWQVGTKYFYWHFIWLWLFSTLNVSNEIWTKSKFHCSICKWSLGILLETGGLSEIFSNHSAGRDCKWQASSMTFNLMSQYVTKPGKVSFISPAGQYNEHWAETLLWNIDRIYIPPSPHPHYFICVYNQKVVKLKYSETQCRNSSIWKIATENFS